MSPAIELELTLFRGHLILLVRSPCAASTCLIALLSAKNVSLCCISTAIWALPYIGLMESRNGLHDWT